MSPALPGLSPALPGAPRLVVDRQALCKRLQHNYSSCEKWNTRVVLMMRIRHHKVKEVHMQRDPSPGRRVACNSPSERTRFRQSHQRRPEHPGVSDGNLGCCWWWMASMRALAMKKTHWKEDFFFTAKLVRQKLSKYCAEVTATMGMLLISAHILKAFRNLQSFRKWDQGIDFNHEDETYHTTQYQEAFLKYMENEYCAKHQGVPVKNTKAYPAAISFPLQQLLDHVNHLLIDMICPAMMKNTYRLTMGLRRHSDEPIMHHTYWSAPGSTWIRRLNHQRTGGKLIPISTITTPTQWILAVHFGYWT